MNPDYPIALRQLGLSLLLAVCSPPIGMIVGRMLTNYVDSLLPDSEAKREGKILFDLSCLPRLVDEGALLVDENDVVARDV